MDALTAAFVGFGVGALGAAAATVLIMVAPRGRERRALAAAEAQARVLADDNEQLRSTLETTRTEREAATVAAATAQAEAHARRQQLDAQEAHLERTKVQLGDTFTALGAQALKANNEQFLTLARQSFDTLILEAKGDSEQRRVAVESLVKPIRDLLDRQQSAVGALESKRERAFEGIEAQLRSMANAHDQLSTQTNRLVTALRRPEQRGRWGEMQLRNAVELAGMSEYCDFVEQPNIETDEGRLRPDMIVNLPGGGSIIIDSKVALDAYLDTLDPDADHDEALQRHARQVADHVRALSSKQYWAALERTPRVVVMFMPLEIALTAALEIKPDLHAEAMRNHVLIATPTLLVGMLRAVAFGWQQEDVAANAREISRAGKLLYERLGRFVESLDKVGASLKRATGSYNSAVASLEARLMPSARQLSRLSAPGTDEPASPDPIDIDVRNVVTPERCDEPAEAPTMRRASAMIEPTMHVAEDHPLDEPREEPLEPVAE